MGYGDHIFVNRGSYEHHGIDVGGGYVIHFAKAAGVKGEIQRHSISVFAQGGEVEIIEYEGDVYPPDEVVARAEDELGNRDYHLLFNNCEHFAMWCKTGENESLQVLRVQQGIEVSYLTYRLFRNLGLF